MAESAINTGTMLAALNEGAGKIFRPATVYARGIQIYTSFSPKYFKPIEESDRYSIRKLKLPITKEYILAVVHLPSKLHRTSDDQAVIASNLVNRMREIERQQGHSRTIVIGDFNMNPFDHGMMQVNAFNTISVNTIARDIGEFRVFSGEKYPFFYNPMWNFFGDVRDGPPGTYYYNSGASTNHYWHIFDQVLLRPEIRKNLVFNSLELITSDGQVPLLSESGRPNSKISDHLPVTCEFRLDLEV